MKAYKIKSEVKVPGTDYILEKGDIVYIRPKRVEKVSKKARKEAYKGKSIRNSDVAEAWDELVDLIGIEAVAEGLYDWFDSSDLADALVSIYIDNDLDEESEYIN